MIDYSIFRDNLNNLMASHHLRAIDLSAHLGITKQTMSRYLNGAHNPDLEYVARIADYFHVSIDWLLGLSEENSIVLTPEMREFIEKYSFATKDDRLVINTILSKYGV